jgi:hypothetical protein
MDTRLTDRSPSDNTEKMIRLSRELEAEKQRRVIAEREARVLRMAIAKWHRRAGPPAAGKVWHP